MTLYWQFRTDNVYARSRKEHIRGMKHRECVIEHYSKVLRV